ncbi:MAG TPA: serine/threonine-protein kinase, partial [Planctomycetia bacterium]|nr:serine/threonine-protein kinase [Planctomycetia bacterium]
MTDANPEHSAGKQFGPYRLLEEIGRGGMGVVYRALDPDENEVAVKVLPPYAADRPVLRQRFVQEAELAKRLEHPNLVKAIDFGQQDGLLYFTMEYVDGENVAEYVQRAGAIPERVAVQIIVGVARALHKAHREGLVHRDVKPDNVLLSRQGHINLADLGLAK